MNDDTPPPCSICAGTGNVMAVRLCGAHGYQHCPYCPPVACACRKQLTLDDALTANREGVSVAVASFHNFVDRLAGRGADDSGPIVCGEFDDEEVAS